MPLIIQAGDGNKYVYALTSVEVYDYVVKKDKIVSARYAEMNAAEMVDICLGICLGLVINANLDNMNYPPKSLVLFLSPAILSPLIQFESLDQLRISVMRATYFGSMKAGLFAP